MRLSRLLPACLPLLALLPASCGAGIVAGGVLGNGGGGGSPSPNSITLSLNRGPLVVSAADFELRRAILRGKRIPADATVRVQFVWQRASQRVVDEQFVILVEPSADQTTITFQMVTTNIVAAVGDPQAQDLDVELEVLADRGGHGEVLFRTPFRLLRQPRLELVFNEPARSRSVVSVAGGELVLHAESLPTRDPKDLIVEVITPSPELQRDPVTGELETLVTRTASNVRLVDVGGGTTEVTCSVPGSAFPTFAVARVVHALAGASNPVGAIVYRPQLSAVASRRGSADGGELISITGRGLVPLDFDATPPALDFSSVRLTFRRGGSAVELGADALRPSLSSLNNIVVVTPPSPDARPGDVTIELKATIELSIGNARFQDEVEVAASGLYAYGASATTFEPRGIGLGTRPTAVAFGRTLAAIDDPAAPFDAIQLGPDPVGVPFVQVFGGLGNGMFARVGLPVQAGARNDLNQRMPIDLAHADFDGDGRGDVFVVNAGVDASVHTLLRGADDRARPLRFAGRAYRGARAPVGVERGHFNNDERVDLLLHGAVEAERTTEIALPDEQARFTTRRVFTQPVARVQAAAVADLDGDGLEDLLFAAGGPGAEVVIAFGDLLTTFQDQRRMPLSGVPPIDDAEVVAIAAVGPPNERRLLLVLRPSEASGALLWLLEPSGVRTWTPATAWTVTDPGTALAAALCRDLDGDGTLELVLAFDGGPLSLWQWTSSGFLEVPGAIELSGADVGRVQSLATGPAVVPSAGEPADALFVTHDVDVGASVESRVTTLLIDEGPRLVDPFGELEMGAAPRAIAYGYFQGLARPPGVAVAVEDAIVLLRNDGIGRLSASAPIAVWGLIAESLTAVATTHGHRLVFLTTEGFVGLLEPGTAQPRFATAPLLGPGGTVSGPARIAAGDVDGDGRIDLVVQLDGIVGPAQESQVVLMVGQSGGAFPWNVPPPARGRWRAPASVADLTLGDFVPETGTPCLEAAVAIAEQGDQSGVHFLRLEKTDPPRLVPSFIDPSEPRLAVSLEPGLIEATDLEGDGIDDLLVVSARLDTLHAFRQSGARSTPFGDVDPLAFRQTAETVLPTGIPSQLQLTDLDGDLIEDVIVHVRGPAPSELQAVSVAILDGVGGFDRGYSLPARRLGPATRALAVGHGDLNGDGVPDLVVGRSEAAGGVIRLLFGSHR